MDDNLKKPDKYVLVCFEHIIGEYEPMGHVVIDVKDNDVDKSIDDYFLDFYGENACDNHDEWGSYYYNGGEVGVRIIRHDVISERDCRLLVKLKLHYASFNDENENIKTPAPHKRRCKFCHGKGTRSIRNKPTVTCSCCGGTGMVDDDDI